MDNSALPPCRTQGDNETVCFVVRMNDQKLDYGPTWKMGHYRWFRIRWCSFKCPPQLLPPPQAPQVLFLYCNSMGTGKTNKLWAGTLGTPWSFGVQKPWGLQFESKGGTYNEYTFSMPIEPSVKIAYNVDSDKWRWMPMPDSANLRNMTFYAFPDGYDAGNAPPGFITAEYPVTFEIEMRCSL
jgi:hypothetical protein